MPVKSPYHDKLIFLIKNILHFDSVILLTLSKFSILSRVKVLGKLVCKAKFTIQIL